MDVQGVNGHFTTQFIRDFSVGHGDIVTLKDCLRQLADEALFEDFRAAAILGYPYNGANVDAALTPVIRAYYGRTLPRCRFEEAYFADNGLWRLAHREELVADIFRKYAFPSPPQNLVELLWMDNAGIPDVSQTNARQSDQLRNKIVAALAGQQQLLREAVLSHLRKGIRWEPVLLSHLALCRQLNIREARPLILNILKKGDLREDNLEKAVVAYIELGGSKKDLASLLEATPEGDAFWHFLMKQLANEFPEHVIAGAIRFLSKAGSYDYREMQIAYLLVKMGRIEGFRFLIRVLANKTERGMILQDEVAMKGLDTTGALAEMDNVMYMAVDSVYTSIPSPHNPVAVLIGWLSALAAKGEKDLLLVLDFLRKMEGDWMERHPAGARELHWQAMRIADRFRTTSEGDLSLEDIKAFLSRTGGLPANV